MDDAKIVELYWERNQRAISETASKYGKYCSIVKQMDTLFKYIFMKRQNYSCLSM